MYTNTLIRLFLLTVTANAEIPRIIGGYQANSRDLPVLASIRDYYQTMICGGTILNERWLLTSGQCVSPAYYVGVGNETLKYQTIYSLDVVKRHPSYSSTTLQHDVGLVRTSTAMQFNTYSVFGAPINTDASHNQIFDQDFYVAGWGVVSTSGTKPASIMYTNYRVLPDSNCTALNTQSASGLPFNTTIQMCAIPQKNNGVQGGVCNGDSGDPLFYNGYIFGVTSRLMKSCGSGYPEVFTKLSFYLSWINSIIVNTV